VKNKGSSSNWGGKRKNQTGRPPTIKNFSEEMKHDVLRALKNDAKESGVSFGEHLVDLYKNAKMETVKLGAGKLISEILVVKETKQTVQEFQGPQIILPPLREKPRPPEQQAEQVH
jgi:hypothetical protein